MTKMLEWSDNHFKAAMIKWEIMFLNTNWKAYQRNSPTNENNEESKGNFVSENTITKIKNSVDTFNSNMQGRQERTI